MSRERKLLSHPLSKEKVEKKVQEAFREVNRDARDGRFKRSQPAQRRK